MEKNKKIVEQLKKRIEKLNDVGQHAFDGTDYSFGFNTWKSGTLTLIRSAFPDEPELIEQIKNIELKRVNHHKDGDSSCYNLEACKKEAREILQMLIDVLNELR